MTTAHKTEFLKGVEHWNAWVEEQREISLGFRADLSGINLADESLCGQLGYGPSPLFGVQLSGVDLNRADLSDCKLARADLSNAKLRGANFQGADLSSVNLNGADIRVANFTDARLYNAWNVQFDENAIQGLKLSWGSGENWPRGFYWNSGFGWLVLQRVYSGSALIFNTLLTVLFLAPYAVRATLWHSISSVQLTAGQIGKKIEQNLSGTEVSPAVTEAVEQLKNLEPGGSDPGATYYLWQVLIGVDRGWWPPILAVAVIVYNAFRWHMTARVSSLSDEQARLGITPEKDKYWKYFLAHRWSLFVLLFVLVSFLINAYSWLSEKVWVPVIG